MRIAINAGTLRGLGSSAIGRGIVGNLAGPGDHLSVWAHESWAPSGLAVHRVRTGLAAKVVTDNWSVRRAAGCDVLFSLGDTGTLRPKIPHLLLVQQAYLVYPREELDFPMPVRFRVHLSAMERYFSLGLRGVSAITVQSHHMRVRLAKRWSYPIDRIHVVPSAIDPFPAVETGLPGEPYVFVPGSPGAHKNLSILPAVMKRVRSSGCELRCVLTVPDQRVAELTAEIDRHGAHEYLECIGSVPPLTARRLMGRASVVVLPSKLESFGLPYYESMSLGRPVVAADREFAREACGGYATYADPDSPESFADAISVAFAAGLRVPVTLPTWDTVCAQYRTILAGLV